MGVRDTYDTIAEAYAAQFTDELSRKPFDARLLASVRDRCGDGVVVDIGCGPGHVGAAAGASVGLDLSPAMLRLAPFPLRVQGDVRSLPFATGALAGAIAFYSLIHLDSLAVAAGELRRVLRARGVLVVAVHEGAGTRHLDEWFGHAVDIDARGWSRDEVVGALESAGFTIESAIVREPYEGEVTDRLYVTAVA